MPKVAARYLEVDPWRVIEKGFHPDRGRVSESIFSLGNEYMGVRGFFEEGYGGPSLIGSFFNGVFDEADIGHPQLFKGLVTEMTFIVNAVNWLYTRIWLGGERLDLSRSRFSDFERVLDLRTGTLTRQFVWTTGKGKRLRLKFVRFVSMASAKLGAQRIELEPLNFSGTVRVPRPAWISPSSTTSRAKTSGPRSKRPPAAVLRRSSPARSAAATAYSRRCVWKATKRSRRAPRRRKSSSAWT